MTAEVTAAEFKLNSCENFENWNFEMPQVSGIKLRYFLLPLVDYSFKRIAKPNKIIGKHKIR